MRSAPKGIAITTVICGLPQGDRITRASNSKHGPFNLKDIYDTHLSPSCVLVSPPISDLALKSRNGTLHNHAYEYCKEPSIFLVAGALVSTISSNAWENARMQDGHAS